MSFTNVLVSLGLLSMSVRGSLLDRLPRSPRQHDHLVVEDFCLANVTITDTTTVLCTTTVPVTEYVETTLFEYVNVTVNSTETNFETSIVVECITESITSTLYFTESITETDLATVTDTETDLATVTDTDTTTATVPATITTWTTETVVTTTYDPCPSTCSVSAATVTLFFWPTDRPFIYPSTYVDPSLGYTFTSPSVYMLIPTIVGTNSMGTVGPSTTDWILDLDLEDVSTIVDGSITQQLTLSDLGTDCPQSADPTAIATMMDSRCAPILAAPQEVTSWAYPCNACGQFGLFDPPYAVPTITDGLLVTTTVTPPPETTDEPAPTSNEPAPTSNEPAPSSEVISSIESTVEDPATSDAGETQVPSTSSDGSTTIVTTTTDGLPTSSVPVAAAPITKAMGGGFWLILTTFTAALLV